MQDAVAVRSGDFFTHLAPGRCGVRAKQMLRQQQLLHQLMTPSMHLLSKVIPLAVTAILIIAVLEVSSAAKGAALVHCRRLEIEGLPLCMLIAAHDLGSALVQTRHTYAFEHIAQQAGT